MRDQLIFQIINEPTRINNILDLVIVNDTNLICSWHQIINDIISDHNSIFLKMNAYPNKPRLKPITKEYYFTDIYKYDTRCNERWPEYM